jgi:hypothetical protein
VQDRARGGHEDAYGDSGSEVYDGDLDGMTAATAEFLAEHGLNMDELLAPSDNDVDDDDIVGNKSSGPAELGYTPWEEERLDSLLFDHLNCQYVEE